MIDAPKLSQIRTVWLEALFIFRPQGEDTLRGNPFVDAQIFPNPVSPVGGEVHFQDGIQWCFVTWWIEGFFNNFSLKALYRFYKNIQHLNHRQIISIEWATNPHNFNSSAHLTSPPHDTGNFEVFYNERCKGVLLVIEIMIFFLLIYPKIGWCQQVGYYFTVDHNLPTVDHNLPFPPSHFSLPIYPMIGRS